MKKIILTAVALTGALFMSMYMFIEFSNVVNGLVQLQAQLAQYAGQDLTQIYGPDVYSQLNLVYINVAVAALSAVLAIFIFALVTLLSRYGNKILGTLFIAVALECLCIGSKILFFESNLFMQLIMVVIPLVIVLLCVIGMIATKGSNKKAVLSDANEIEDFTETESGHSAYVLDRGRTVKKYFKK